MQQPGDHWVEVEHDRLVMSTSPCWEERSLYIYKSQLEAALVYSITYTSTSSIITPDTFPFDPSVKFDPESLTHIKIREKNPPILNRYQVTHFLKKKELRLSLWISICAQHLHLPFHPRFHQGLDNLNNFIETQTARVIFIMSVKHFLEHFPAAKTKSCRLAEWDLFFEKFVEKTSQTILIFFTCSMHGRPNISYICYVLPCQWSQFNMKMDFLHGGWWFAIPAWKSGEVKSSSREIVVFLPGESCCDWPRCNTSVGNSKIKQF